MEQEQKRIVQDSASTYSTESPGVLSTAGECADWADT